MTWPLIILPCSLPSWACFGMPWASQVYNLLGIVRAPSWASISRMASFNALVAGISLFVAGLGWFFG